MDAKQLIRIAIADDHRLLRTPLAAMINTFENCSVIFEADNGKELITAIEEGRRPDLVLLDLNMPSFNGYQTAAWLHENHPEIQVVVFSMFDAEIALIRLVQMGVSGFLKKDSNLSELRTAIYTVTGGGYFTSDVVSKKLINLLRLSTDDVEFKKKVFTEPEIRFLELSSTDMTYKEIATVLNMSARAVDTLRDKLFTRLSATSRIGLALCAVRSGLVFI